MRFIGLRPFDVQLAAGVVLHNGRSRRGLDGRRQDAGRHFARRPGQRDAGRARGFTSRRSTITWPSATPTGPAHLHRHRPDRRLPATWCRMTDERPQGRLQRRHHLRHRVRVRLRFPARSLEDQERRGPKRPVLVRLGQQRPGQQAGRSQGSAWPSLRPGRRGGQHLRRRGADAARHQHQDPPRHRSRIGRIQMGRQARQGHGAGSAFLSGREEAEGRVDRSRPTPDSLLEPAVRAALARHGQAARARRARHIHANHRFRRDQHYMVVDDKIIIIDESTGRPMPDRQWNEGLHQGGRGQGRCRSTTRPITPPRSPTNRTSSCTKSWPA